MAELCKYKGLVFTVMGEITILLYSVMSFLFLRRVYLQSLKMSLETLDDFLNSFFFLSSLISNLEMITHQKTKTMKRII